MDIDIFNRFNKKIGSNVEFLDFDGINLAGKSAINRDNLKYYGCIYEVICDINLKNYVGKQTCWKTKRPSQVNSYLGSGGPYYKNAINKYGEIHFHKFYLDVVMYDNIKTEEDMKNELNEKEKYWISVRNGNNKEIGYNLKTGGDGGWDIVSKMNIGRVFVSKGDDLRLIKPEELDYYLSEGYQLGMSDKTKKLMSENSWIKGKNHTEETKKLMSKNSIGKNLGKVRTEEQKLQQSIDRTGRLWVTNTIEEHWVFPDEMESFLKLKGWKEGRLLASESAKKKMTESRLGRVWVHNELEQRFATKEDSIKLLEKGYSLGRGSRTRKIKE